MAGAGGGFGEALFLIGFAGVRFDAGDVRDGVGELAGLVVFGFGHVFFAVGSFGVGDGGGDSVGDEHGEKDAGDGWADEKGGDKGIGNGKNERVDAPDKVGL